MNKDKIAAAGCLLVGMPFMIVHFVVVAIASFIVRRMWETMNPNDFNATTDHYIDGITCKTRDHAARMAYIRNDMPQEFVDMKRFWQTILWCLAVALIATPFAVAYHTK